MQPVWQVNSINALVAVSLGGKDTTTLKIKMIKVFSLNVL